MYMPFYSRLNKTSLLRNSVEIVNCIGPDTVVNVSCPLRLDPISLHCEATGAYFVLCSSKLAPSCDAINSNILTKCNLLDYSEYGVVCQCTSYATKTDNLVPGSWELTSSLMSNTSYSTFFFHGSEDISGSISVYIASVYGSILLFFMCCIIMKFSRKQKIKSGVWNRTQLTDVIDDYLNENFFDKVFSGIYSTGSLRQRAVSIFVKKLRLFQVLNLATINSSEEKPVRTIKSLSCNFIHLYL